MRRPRLTYANVVATICLFLVLGGGAWAATSLPKNSVGTKQLKNGAVTGAKVKKGALTGADIRASTLGRVPQAASAETAASAGHATSADNAVHADSATSAGHATSADSATRAGDATTLGGSPPAAFLPAGHVLRVAYETDWGTEPIAFRTVLATGPLTLSADCVESQEGGAHTLLEIVATGASGSTIDFSQIVGTEPKAGVVSLSPGSTEVVARLVSESVPLHAFLTLVYRDAARTISIPVGVYAGSPDDVCRIVGSAVVAE